MATANALSCFYTIVTNHDESGAPNDSFLSDPLKHYFRQSGVPLKLCRFILVRAIIFERKIHKQKRQSWDNSLTNAKPASIPLSIAFPDEENKNK